MEIQRSNIRCENRLPQTADSSVSAGQRRCNRPRNVSTKATGLHASKRARTLVCASLASALEAEHGSAQAGFAGRPDLVEAAGQRLRLLRLIDSQRGARLLEMETMQIMPAVDDQQRISRYLSLRAGLIDRQRMAIVAQEPQQMRASALEIAGVVHDDVQPPAADLAQERSQPVGASGTTPPGLRQILIEHADMLARQSDQGFDRFGLLGQR